MATFTGKIICNHCGKFYKRKLERGKYRWVCQGYDNYSECTRIAVDESAMIEFISRRLYVQDRIQDKIERLLETVTKITVDGRDNFQVYFENAEPMYRYEGHIQY